MNRTLTIGVSRNGKIERGYATVHQRKMRERIVRWLFGEEQMIVFVAPGPRIDEIAIKETEGGATDE
jgi:hypothetical protein